MVTVGVDPASRGPFLRHGTMVQQWLLDGGLAAGMIRVTLPLPSLIIMKTTIRTTLLLLTPVLALGFASCQKKAETEVKLDEAVKASKEAAAAVGEAAKAASSAAADKADGAAAGTKKAFEKAAAAAATAGEKVEDAANTAVQKAAEGVEKAAEKVEKAADR